MPRGFSALKEAQKKYNNDDKERGPSVLFLKLENDGDTANIRALEEGDDVYFYNYHDFSGHEKDGWMTKIPCLDQSADGEVCPGCAEELNRGFQGLINVIWRDAPLYERDENGAFARDKNNKIIQKGVADQVAVWRVGWTLFGTLGKKDVAYKGLGSRDLEVTRDGAKGDKKTKYHVEPADLDSGPQELSKEDKELVNGKYDLHEITRPVDEKKFSDIINAKLDTSGDDDDSEDIESFMKEKPFND